MLYFTLYCNIILQSLEVINNHVIPSLMRLEDLKDNAMCMCFKPTLELEKQNFNNLIFFIFYLDFI